jgi:serine/threonine protein phosphatase PrpC
VLDPDALKAILEATPDEERAAQTIVDTALEQGSRDNVTALVVRYEAGA